MQASDHAVFLSSSSPAKRMIQYSADAWKAAGRSVLDTPLSRSMALVSPAMTRERRTTPMILIGQYDSPFVRRVAIALRLYGLPFEQRPWSTFGDADKLARYNPLRRVPTLVLDDGEVLIESGAMLDHLDELVGPVRR